VVSSASTPEENQDRVTEGSESDQNRLLHALTEELARLRTGKGLVFDQIQDCQNLKSLAHTWKKDQAGRIIALNDAHAAIEMVVTFLEEEQPIAYRDSLKATYGIIVPGTSQAERVKRYLGLPKAQKTVYSESSIERYSRRMAAQLAARLAAIANSGMVNAGGIDAGSRQVSIHAEVSSPLRVRSNETLLRFGPNRVIDDILHIMHVEAITAGVHMRNVCQEYFSDHRDGAVKIFPEFGCEAVGEQIFENGIAHMILRIPRSLEIGESHLFMFRMKINSLLPAHPPAVTVAPVSDMDQHTLRIQFHQDAIPAKVWKFSLPSHYEVRCAKYREQVPVPHNGSRFASAHWQDLKAGRSYGIAWDWADDNVPSLIDDQVP